MPEPLKGNGYLWNPDRSEFCEDIDLLMVHGGKPTTEAGKRLREEHEATCTWCARPGRYRSLIDVMIDRTPEAMARLEAIFGPIEWSD